MLFRRKITHVYLPFLSTFFIGSTAYTFFHWLIVYFFHIVPLANILTNVILPAVANVGFLFLFHLPVMKRMDLTVDKKWTGSGRLTPLYGYLLWIILTIPTVMAQFYLRSVAGEWRVLNKISEIDQHRPAPFYIVNNPDRLHFVREHASSHYDSSVSGRYRSGYNLTINIVVPMFDSPRDAVQDKPVPAWFGMNYKRKLSNFKPKTTKQQASRDLSDLAWKELEEQNLSSFTFLERVYKRRYEKALDNNPWYDVSNRNILIPVHETITSYRDRQRKPFLISLSGCFVWLVMVLFRPLKSGETVA